MLLYKTVTPTKSYVIYTTYYILEYTSQDSVVGIMTCYRLDSLGIESWWGARFSAPVKTSPGAHPASYIMATQSFLG
jgi:hypothetical protein